MVDDGDTKEDRVSVGNKTKRLFKRLPMQLCPRRSSYRCLTSRKERVGLIDVPFNSDTISPQQLNHS